VRPPALVCEYLANGSLRSAINAAAEWLAAPQAKVKLMLDTARVGGGQEGRAARAAGVLRAAGRRGGWGPCWSLAKPTLGAARMGWRAMGSRARGGYQEPDSRPAL
jgi:hypothetical protein